MREPEGGRRRRRSLKLQGLMSPRVRLGLTRPWRDRHRGMAAAEDGAECDRSATDDAE